MSAKEKTPSSSVKPGATKLWSGRFSEPVDDLVKRFTASVGFDQRLAEFDIQGSIAHARMLRAVGILIPADLEAIEKGLASIGAEIREGTFPWSLDLEDVPTWSAMPASACIPDARATTRSPPTCGCICAPALITC
jgi:argininosuccinate lyase